MSTQGAVGLACACVLVIGCAGSHSADDGATSGPLQCEPIQPYRVECGETEHLGGLSWSLADSARDLSLVALDADEDSFVLLLRSAEDRGFKRYAVISYREGERGLRNSTAWQGPLHHSKAGGGTIRLLGDGSVQALVPTVERDSGAGPRYTTLKLHDLRWDDDGSSPEATAIGSPIHGLPLCAPCAVPTLVHESESLGLFGHGARLEGVRAPLDDHAAGERVALGSLPDGPDALTTLDAIVLEGGELAVAGGGPVAVGSPRASFVSVQSSSPRHHMLPGSKLDAAPRIVRRDDGLVAFRALEVDGDLDATTLMAWTYGPDLERRASASVPTAAIPLHTYAAPDGPDGPFAVWTERAPGTLEEGQVRLLPHLPEGSCATVEAPPVVTARSASSAVAAWRDGSWYLFVTGDDLARGSGPGVGVFRIDGCRLRAAE